MPSYEVADSDVQDRIAEIIKKHHQHLADEDVDVRALMAIACEGEHAVKLHGYPCFAIVKIVGLKERVQGLGDALIIIDQEAYLKMDEKTRDALIDHEITHLHLRKNKDGVQQYDEHGRPQLKMKLHDWQLGGFASISQRYGGTAIEVRAVQHASDEFGQLFWNWEGAPKWRKSKGAGLAATTVAEDLDVK